MRRATYYRVAFGCKRSELSGDRTSETFQEGEMERRVEEHLRTYMLAGIELEELE